MVARLLTVITCPHHSTFLTSMSRFQADKTFTLDPLFSVLYGPIPSAFICSVSVCAYRKLPWYSGGSEDSFTVMYPFISSLSFLTVHLSFGPFWISSWSKVYLGNFNVIIEINTSWFTSWCKASRLLKCLSRSSYNFRRLVVSFVADWIFISST